MSQGDKLTRAQQDDEEDAMCAVLPEDIDWDDLASDDEIEADNAARTAANKKSGAAAAGSVAAKKTASRAAKKPTAKTEKEESAPAKRAKM